MTTCKACSDPLIVTFEDEEDPSAAPLSVPDDLELPCGCHFHWSCLLDQSPQIAVSLKCPSCGTYLPANQAGPSVTNAVFPTPDGAAAVLVRYTNEGGVQEGLDILPNITEEAYLDANPEARPARAFHVLCAEGDIGGIVELLQDAAGEGADVAALVRYQDPLSGMKSGLHLAIEKAQEEVVWLLLWLAAPVPREVFPQAAVEAAEMMGVGRPNQFTPDIRSLRDAQGRTAEQVAGVDGKWLALVKAGVLQSS